MSLFVRSPNRSPIALLMLIITGVLLASLLGVVTTASRVYSAPTAPEIFGSVAGRVTDAQGNPLPNIIVELESRYEAIYMATTYLATTDANGNYHIGLIVTGIYLVRFRDPTGRYTTQYYPTAESNQGATLLSVNGSAITDIDTTLQSAGQIRGSVTTSPALPLGEVTVTLYRVTPRVQQTGYQLLAPGAQQFWFGGLQPGVYAVCAAGSTTDEKHYSFQECYDDYLADPRTFQADPITVTAGSVVSDVNFVFGDSTNLVTIDGFTLAADRGPLVSIAVWAWRWWNAGWNPERITASAADGTFTLAHLLPGRYALTFTDPAGAYLFDQGAPDPQLTRVITVALPTGGAQATVTATLMLGAQITGVVMLQGETLPSDGQVILYASDDRINELTRAPIDPLTGHYQLKGLQAGAYQLYAEAYREQARFTGYYGADQTAPTTITVARGERKREINFALYNHVDPYRGMITGTVTAQGQPLFGIKVQLYHHTFDGIIPVAFTLTDAHGHYQLRGLPRDEYYLGFTDPQQRYAAIYYPNQRMINDSLHLDSASVHTNVNAELIVGGLIEGQIANSNGEPVANAEVVSFWPNGDNWAFGFATISDETGYYQLPALVPDTYRLGIFAQVGHPTKEYYDNAGSVESATDLVVRAGTVLQADVVIGPRVIISTAYLPLLQR